MDFTQKKLTKEEWEFLELPVNDDEMKILKLIHNSWENVGYTYNENLSMLSFMKMKGGDDTHLYIYKNYFEGLVNKINKKEKIKINIKNKNKIKKNRSDENQ